LTSSADATTGPHRDGGGARRCGSWVWRSRAGRGRPADEERRGGCDETANFTTSLIACFTSLPASFTCAITPSALALELVLLPSCLRSLFPVKSRRLLDLPLVLSMNSPSVDLFVALIQKPVPYERGEHSSGPPIRRVRVPAGAPTIVPSSGRPACTSADHSSVSQVQPRTKKITIRIGIGCPVHTAGRNQSFLTGVRLVGRRHGTCSLLGPTSNAGAVPGTFAARRRGEPPAAAQPSRRMPERTAICRGRHLMDVSGTRHAARAPAARCPRGESGARPVAQQVPEPAPEHSLVPTIRARSASLLGLPVPRCGGRTFWYANGAAASGG